MSQHLKSFWSKKKIVTQNIKNKILISAQNTGS